jgi:hypothetical protein
MAANMSIYSSTSFKDALSLPVDVIEEFFDSSGFKELIKHKEFETKYKSAVINRLNGVITAVGRAIRHG